MGKYNYKEAIKESIKELVSWGDIKTPTSANRDDIYDALMNNDSVTGNDSGSFTCNTYQAEEFLCHNLGLLQDACDEFCCDPDLRSPERCDVTIRCYLLGECLDELIEEEGWDEEEEEEEESEE